jgi:hypothetical protein
VAPGPPDKYRLDRGPKALKRRDPDAEEEEAGEAEEEGAEGHGVRSDSGMGTCFLFAASNILNSPQDSREIITESSKSRVASIAEQPTDLPCLVIVVDMKIGKSTTRFAGSTNRTTAVLMFKYTVILFFGDSILAFQLIPSTDAIFLLRLSPSLIGVRFSPIAILLNATAFFAIASMPVRTSAFDAEIRDRFGNSALTARLGQDRIDGGHSDLSSRFVCSRGVGRVTTVRRSVVLTHNHHKRQCHPSRDSSLMD